MSSEAKQYFIPANEELVEVSEELYREYYRPIWNTRYHVRKNGECSCTKAQLWKCDGVCPGCPFYTAGKKVSLDTVIGGENDELTLGDTLADDSQTIESIIIQKELLEALYEELDRLDPKAYLRIDDVPFRERVRRNYGYGALYFQTALGKDT